MTAISGALPVSLTVASAALVDTGTGQTWPLPLIPLILRVAPLLRVQSLGVV